MKAVVVESNSTYFEVGEQFDILHVSKYRDGFPAHFDIKIPDDRYGGRTLAYCRQNVCHHLNGGKWAFLPEE